MMLNNYWKIRSFFNKTYIANDSNTYNIGLVDISGNSIGILRSSNMSPNNSCLRVGLKALLGIGDTAVSSNDYCLDNDVTASITNLQITVSDAADDAKEITIITITGVNNSGSDINIKEIGLSKNIIYNYAYGYNSDVLLVRSVLNNPITILNGNSFTIPLEWTEGEEE